MEPEGFQQSVVFQVDAGLREADGENHLFSGHGNILQFGDFFHQGNPDAFRFQSGQAVSQHLFHPADSSQHLADGTNYQKFFWLVIMNLIIGFRRGCHKRFESFRKAPPEGPNPPIPSRLP